MSDGTWHPTACILCECNCGIEVRLGGDDGRRFERIRGDKAHPASQGYACEKALRLDHYQNGRAPPDVAAAPPRRRHVRGDRLGHRDPRGRRAASPRCATPTAASRSSTTAAAGRGTTSAAPTAAATLRGARARATARTRSRRRRPASSGSNGKMLGALRARRLRALRGRAVPRQEPVAVARHPARPRDAEGDRQRPGALADRDRPAPHRDRRARRLPPPGAARAPTPGCLAALGAVLVQEDLVDRALARRARRRASTRSTAALRRASTSPPTARVAGVDEDLVRARGPAHRRAPSSVAVFEDLGVQMNAALDAVELPREAVWLLTGNFGKPGAQYVPDQPREPRRAAASSGGGLAARQPGRRRADHRRPRALQRDRRGDPHRPPDALPRDAGRERQPGPLARRQPAHARGARRARARSS